MRRETFIVYFRAVFAVAVSAWAMTYLWAVTFTDEPLSKYAEFIIGFILGTLISTIIQFYFGGKDDHKRSAMRKTDSTGGSNGSGSPGDDRMPRNETDRGDVTD